MPPSYAFTTVADGLSNVLKNLCVISPADEPEGEFHGFEAIWDTGATHSSITQEVVDRCGLESIGKTKVYHAGIDDEPDETDNYLVNIRLPNRVTVQNVQVSRGGFSGADILIGMDIISGGDFAITHMGGKTKFTFQVPAQADIDFVKAQPLPPPVNREERRARQRSKNRR